MACFLILEVFISEQSNQNWTIREVLTWITNRFKQAGIETALLDAQLLLCKVLNTQKINLYIDIEKPLTEVERSNLRNLVKRRLNGEPVAYITNEKYWYNLKLYVDQRVLIPRPETECLLDFVFETTKLYSKTPNIIFDFCTGSGCLAIALAKVFTNSKIVAIDISQDALTVARQNAELNQVTNIEWLKLNLTKSESFALLKEDYGQAQLIVANPPYISETEWNTLDITVKNYEPKLALMAEEGGLFIGKEIIKNLKEFNLLCEEFSVFGMEMGDAQPVKLVNMLNQNLTNTQKKLEIQHSSDVNLPEKEKHINKWFTVDDLDRKNRFLCFIQTKEQLS